MDNERNLLMEEPPAVELQWNVAMDSYKKASATLAVYKRELSKISDSRKAIKSRLARIPADPYIFYSFGQI